MAVMRALHISRVDLNLFVVFETIHAEGGITRAAEKLHLSQPAISHALSRLREMFGDPLFVRQGQSMIPTPLARNLVEPVRQALRALEGTLNESGPFDPAHSHRRFVLGLRAELEAVLLPPLVAKVSAAAPFVELSAVRLDRRRLEADLASGALDAAVDVLVSGSGALRQSRLGTDSLVVVVRRGHPKAAGAPELEDYLRWDHVLVSSRRRGASLEDVALQKLGAQRHVTLRCQQYFAAFRVVAETDTQTSGKCWLKWVATLPLPTAVGPASTVSLGVSVKLGHQRRSLLGAKSSDPARLRDLDLLHDLACPDLADARHRLDEVQDLHLADHFVGLPSLDHLTQ